MASDTLSPVISAHILSNPSATWRPPFVNSVVGGLQVEGTSDGVNYTQKVGLADFEPDIAEGNNISGVELKITPTAITNDDNVSISVEHYVVDGLVDFGDYTTTANPNAALILLSTLSVGVTTTVLITNGPLYTPRNGRHGYRFTVNDAPAGTNILTATVEEVVYYSAVQKPTQLQPSGVGRDRTEDIACSFMHHDGLNRPMTALDWQWSSDSGATWEDEAHVVTTTEAFTIPADTLPAGSIKIRVRTYVGADFGPYSDAATFTAGGPVETPTDVSPSGTVTTAFPTISASSTVTGRLAAYFRAIDATTSEVYYSSGRVAGSGLSKLVTVALPEGVLKAQVAVEDENGIVSGWGEAEFTTILDPVPIPTIEALPIEFNFGEQSGVALRVTAPAAEEGESEIESISIQRFFSTSDIVDFESATWVTIISGRPPVAGLVTFDDYEVPPNRTAYYRAVATGENGGTSTSEVTNATIRFRGVMIHRTSDPAGSIIHLPMLMPTTIGFRPSRDKSFIHYHGFKYPFISGGEHKDAIVPLSFRSLSENQDVVYVRNPDQVRSLIDSNEPLCVRTSEVPYGNTFIGCFDGEYPSSVVTEWLMRGYEFSLSFRLAGEQVLSWLN